MVCDGAAYPGAMSEPAHPGGLPPFQQPYGSGIYGPPDPRVSQHGQHSSTYPPPEAQVVPQQEYPGQPAPGTPPAMAMLDRPAAVTMAATLAITASVQWVGALSFAWLVAVSARESLATQGPDGALLHFLERFHFRMIDGLAWPLYLFPVVAFVTALMLLSRSRVGRIAFTVTGVAALGWSAWWLRESLQWWAIPAAYLAFVTALAWTPGARRWFRT